MTTGTGAMPPRRPDQHYQPGAAGVVPGQRGNINARQVRVFGAGGGVFVYDATRTILKSSDCGAATTDPLLGIACPEGIATYNTAGKVLSLLSTANKAFFQYADAGASQGQLIASLSSTGGTDPVAGFNYNAGLYGLDPVGGNITTAGPVISFGEIPYTRSAQIKPVIPADNAHRPFLQLDAPEQTTASHLQMIMAGGSPDGTKSAQLLVGVQPGSALLVSAGTANVLEIQGDALIGPGGPGGVQPGFWHLVQPGTSNVETLHAFTGANSWAQSAGAPVWGFQLMIENEVEVSGACVVPAGFAANQAVAAAVPTAYRPANSAPSLLAWDVGPAGATKDIACRFYMTTGGVLMTSPAFPAGVAAGDIISFPTQRYRLT